MNRARARLLGKIWPRLHNSSGAGEKWKHQDSADAALVVKGTSRQVIVVRSPDPRLFEEAIFVLKEDHVRSKSADQVMEEARRAAADYIRRSTVGGRRRGGARVLPVVIAAAGAAAGLAWLTLHFL